jgi:hypothetical protein
MTASPLSCMSRTWPRSVRSATWYIVADGPIRP